MKRFVAVPVWNFTLAMLMVILFGLISQPTFAQDDDPFGEAVFDTDSAEADQTEAPSVEDAIDIAPPKVPQIWADDDYDREANALIRKKLHGDLKSEGLDFQETPLEEVVDYLRDEYQLIIQIDELALDDLGLSPDEAVTVSLRNIKLGAALRFMLKPFELTTVIQDGMLVVTSEDKALSQLKVVIYPVADLVDADYLTREDLLNAIKDCIASDSWSGNSGEGNICFLFAQGSLVITQTEDVHTKIYSFLMALRSCSDCNPVERVIPTYGGGSGLGGGGGQF